MNRVLDELEKIITVEALSKYGVSRVAFGTLKDAYPNGELSGIISMGDNFPVILISPGDQPTEPSGIANCIKKVFQIGITLFYNSQYAPDTYKSGNKDNLVKTSNELANFLEQLLSRNKKLNGIVCGWSKKWGIKQEMDAQKNQLTMISTEWFDDTIPFDSVSNNQIDTIVDPEQRVDISFYDI